MILKELSLNNKDKKENRQAILSNTLNVKKFLYRCDWCGHEFERVVSSIKNIRENFGVRKDRYSHSNISSQVQCPMCNNFIRTFDGDNEI